MVLASCAVISSIVGGLRWWRLQQGLLRGVGISGGGEILIIAGIIATVNHPSLILTIFMENHCSLLNTDHSNNFWTGFGYRYRQRVLGCLVECAELSLQSPNENNDSDGTQTLINSR